MPDPMVEIIGRINGLQKAITGLERRDTAHIACDHFLRLPGLRGFWPMSAFDSTGAAQDQSGHGHHLTYNGNPTYNYAGLAPYVDLDGTGDSLSRADEADFDITGTAPFVAAAARGLTLGGWFWMDSLVPAVNAYMSKWKAANDLSYILYETGGAYCFSIDDNGIAPFTTVTSTVAAATGAWKFVVGRFVPATTLDIWVNETKTTAATAVASIFSGTADFHIGYDPADASYLDGRASLCFLCAAALSDTIVQSLYQATRALFRV